MILLDTCTLLWMTSDPAKIGPAAKKRILQHKDGLFVSSISAFEIGVKAHKGQLQLPFEIERWFAASLEFYGIRDLPVSAAIAIRSTKLPFLHRDPCDRMIVATAQIEEMTLLTPDPLIRRYPDLKVEW